MEAMRWKCQEWYLDSVDKSILWFESLWINLVMYAYIFFGLEPVMVATLLFLVLTVASFLTIRAYLMTYGMEVYRYWRRLRFDVLYVAARITVFLFLPFGEERAVCLLLILQQITILYVALALTGTETIENKFPQFLVGYALAAKNRMSRGILLGLDDLYDAETAIQREYPEFFVGSALAAKNGMSWGSVLGHNDLPEAEMDVQLRYSAKVGGAKTQEVGKIYPELDPKEEAGNGLPPLEDTELEPREDDYAEEEEEAGNGLPPLQDTELEPQEDDDYAEEEEEAGSGLPPLQDTELEPQEDDYTEEEEEAGDDDYTEEEELEDEDDSTEEEDDSTEEEEEEEDEYYRELEQELEEMAALHDKEILQYQDEFNKLSMDHQKERAAWETERQTLLKVISEREAQVDGCRAASNCFYKESMKEYMELVREWRADWASSSRLRRSDDSSDSGDSCFRETNRQRASSLRGRLWAAEEEVEKMKGILEKLMGLLDKSEKRRSALQAEKDDLSTSLSNERVKCQAFERWMSQVISG